MIFTVKADFDMEIVKLTTSYGENSNSDHVKFRAKIKSELMSK